MSVIHSTSRIVRLSLCVFALSLPAACSDRKQDTDAGSAGNVAAEASCDNLARVDTLPSALREASGIAAGTHGINLLWAHNDGGNIPVLFALDTLGRVQGRVRIAGGMARADWEDVAVASCAAGSCIYLADIGDNLADRDAVSVIRFAEPDPARDSVVSDIDVFAFRYPDGPHDAEALFVLPGERIFVVTKGRNAPVALFAYDGPLRADTVTLRHVQDLSAGLVQLPQMVTGASASADGNRIALRTYSSVRFYQAGTADSLTPLTPNIPLEGIGEFQGEGIALTPGGTTFLLGEIGFDTVPPPLSRLSCR